MKFVQLRPSKIGLSALVLLMLASLIFPLWYKLNGQVTPIVIGLTFLVLVWAVVDLFSSLSPPSIIISRVLPDYLSLYQRAHVEITFKMKGHKKVELIFSVHFPNSWDVNNTENKAYNRITLLPDSEHTVTLIITPKVRGETSILGTSIRCISRFKLWDLAWFVDDASAHKVYPNFTAITDMTGLNGTVNLSQAGLKKFNLRGAGMDFLQLRDYREGESIRQIDWRASSRFNKLISKEFQEEKNQHLLIMLDSGARMRVQDDDLSYFDHTLNALILLSYVALKQGDKVSIQTFGTESRWLSGVNGVKNVSRILNHFYDLYPQKVASDYVSAAIDLVTKQSKRSLVLMVTCLRDEDFDDVLKTVKLLQEKHLVAVLCIEEPIYKQNLALPVTDFNSALRYVSSERLQGSISQNIKLLQHHGVICVHESADKLTASAINTYLSIKKAGLL